MVVGMDLKRGGYQQFCGFDMQEQRESSVRFFIQMALNIFLCRKGQEVIAKAVVRQDRTTLRTLLYFLLLASVLFLVNQELYFYFKNPNLYQKLGLPRAMTIQEMKQWGRRELPKLAPQARQSAQEMLGVLTHPARRLSYDSFGFSDVQYAWAFKYPSFLLQTIIGSGVFFVMATFMSLMNRRKEDLKQAFKLEIFAMIVLFIWEVDLIVTTESRLHLQGPSSVDMVYTAFPVFEQREMLKAIIIPCMSLVQIFVRYYTQSRSQQRFLLFGSVPALLREGSVAQEQVAKLKPDQHLEDRVNVALEEVKRSHPLQTEIFRGQRDLLRRLLMVGGQEVLVRPRVARLLRYFMIK